MTELFRLFQEKMFHVPFSLFLFLYIFYISIFPINLAKKWNIEQKKVEQTEQFQATARTYIFAFPKLLFT